MTEEERNKTFDPDFKPTELSKLISKYKQIVKLAKNNREQYPCHNGIAGFMSNKNQREASVLHWLLVLDQIQNDILYKERDQSSYCKFNVML